MSSKSYYGYCRPKLPNYPWSLEKIPIGRTILTTSRDIDLKFKKSMPFDVKVTDDIGITLNADGTFTLPIGKYLIEIQTTAQLPVAGQVSLLLGNQELTNYLQAESPSTMTSMIVADIIDDTQSIGLFNQSKEPVKLINNIIVITRI